MALVDVVVVSYNSRRDLRACVSELAALDWVNVIVVDNDSSDDSLDVVSDLPVDAVASGWNGGFAFGVNVGWRRGRAPYVLLLNPDARIAETALQALVATLDCEPEAAVAAPKIVESDGVLDFSQRRFPRLRSTYAAAFFLHRLFPRAPWVDEVVRDEAAYELDGSPDWVSGACMLVRRDVLEELDGLDESFFMYAEDKDLCRRARSAGHEIRFVAAAACSHVGGASTPSAAAEALLARSRRRYALKHHGRGALLEQIGIALRHATHVVVARGGGGARAAHARALLAALRPLAAPPSRPVSPATLREATASGVETAHTRN
jgi:N-acetylglucosaminyl-diphospho-decaprenol L-rhamnosyltransferase